MANKYTPTIGLEVHIELRTKSGMFCGCSTDHFGKPPNTNTCPVCLGLPGALPVPNKTAIDWAMLIGLALNSKINKDSKFDRKHYNYPDLPKGYQISQYDQPLCEGGFVETTDGRVRLTRVHIEEDTGKLQHKKLNGRDVSLVDFNRSGVPLVEIVTEPDISSGAQAKEFAQKLQNIVRFLEVSDCDMEKGSMRLEANTSWGLNLGYKVEVKNLNSFKFVDRAIEFELARQKALLDAGETPKQETRGWDEAKNVTVSQRFKETSADYRYFPEPDIPPMKFSGDYIDSLRKKLPKLPVDYTKEFVDKYDVRASYADILTSDLATAKYARTVFVKATQQKVSCDALAGKIVNKEIDIRKVPEAKLIGQFKSTLDEKIADDVQLTNWVDAAIVSSASAVADYKAGKEAALQVLVGKVMGASKGRADAKKVIAILKEKLK